MEINNEDFFKKTEENIKNQEDIDKDLLVLSNNKISFDNTNKYYSNKNATKYFKDNINDINKYFKNNINDINLYRKQKEKVKERNIVEDIKLNNIDNFNKIIDDIQNGLIVIDSIENLDTEILSKFNINILDIFNDINHFNKNISNKSIHQFNNSISNETINSISNSLKSINKILNFFNEKNYSYSGEQLKSINNIKSGLLKIIIKVNDHNQNHAHDLNNKIQELAETIPDQTCFLNSRKTTLSHIEFFKKTDSNFDFQSKNKTDKSIYDYVILVDHNYDLIKDYFKKTLVNNENSINDIIEALNFHFFKLENDTISKFNNYSYFQFERTLFVLCLSIDELMKEKKINMTDIDIKSIYSINKFLNNMDEYFKNEDLIIDEKFSLFHNKQEANLFEKKLLNLYKDKPNDFLNNFIIQSFINNFNYNRNKNKNDQTNLIKFIVNSYESKRVDFDLSLNQLFTNNKIKLDQNFFYQLLNYSQQTDINSKDLLNLLIKIKKIINNDEFLNLKFDKEIIINKIKCYTCNDLIKQVEDFNNDMIINHYTKKNFYKIITDQLLSLFKISKRKTKNIINRDNDIDLDIDKLQSVNDPFAKYHETAFFIDNGEFKKEVFKFKLLKDKINNWQLNTDDENINTFLNNLKVNLTTIIDKAIIDKENINEYMINIINNVDYISKTLIDANHSIEKIDLLINEYNSNPIIDKTSKEYLNTINDLNNEKANLLTSVKDFINENNNSYYVNKINSIRASIHTTNKEMLIQQKTLKMMN